MKARWAALVIGMMALTAAGFAQQQPAPGREPAPPDAAAGVIEFAEFCINARQVGKKYRCTPR